MSNPGTPSAPNPWAARPPGCGKDQSILGQRPLNPGIRPTEGRHLS
jgi:hypothetical protein